MYDIAIIGGGVVGCAIARELSKYKLKLCLLERGEDVALGASKGNSGIVHGGYAAKYGTLKGRLCVKGNELFEKLNEELSFGYRRPGALVVGFDEQDEKTIKGLYENGIKIGCDDLEIIAADRIREIEPYINEQVRVALYAKSVGVTSPYEMTIALAENAIENGLDLKLSREVKAIEKSSQGFIIHTEEEQVESRYVINAAGLYSDRVAKMVGADNFSIIPRRGQYVLLGKDQRHLANTVIFQCPTKKGKGILVTTTYHGNLMIGPNAEEEGDREDVGTTLESLQEVIETARKSIKDFNIKRALTTFAGIRATSNTDDFIIEESPVKGFINVAGIDSPGLTSSPAIAEMVVDILLDIGLQLEKKHNFNPYRRAIIASKEADFQGKIDHEDPSKNIICRCEQVTEQEIVDCLHRGIEVTTIDAVKRRTRAGMGTCQGGFCRERVRKLIARETGLSQEQVADRGTNYSIQTQRVSIKEIRNLR